MMRPPNVLYLLLTALTTAGALRVSMNTRTLSALKDEDVTIHCNIFDLNIGGAISIIWLRTLANGAEQDVYHSIDGRPKIFRAGCSMDQTQILKGNAALHIPRVQISDEGEYTCKVINTPDAAGGTAVLQVSAPPLADVTPPDPRIELGTDKTLMCKVHSFYPKDISVRWGLYCKDSSDCEVLDIWTCAKSMHENSDGTYSMTSLLTLNPKKEDDGNRYSCIISHRSLRTDLSRDLTITVTEREDNSGAVTTAVIMTLLFVAFLALLGFLYVRFVKKDPPTLSEITGNNELIDMKKTTLTCQIMDFRPKIIEISVRLRRSGEEMKTIYTWKSDGHPPPIRAIRDDDGGGQVVVDVEIPLINGSAGHEDRPLQLEVDHKITKKKLGVFSCQCSLHITPSYDLDNEAELSLYVNHPALKSPAVKHRKLNVVGVVPKLLSIMSPKRVIHDEHLTLTCPINGFKPRDLTVTWLKRDRNHQETELLTWNSEGKTSHSERYKHNLKEHEHEDKSYSIISALTMKPTVTEDHEMMYICRTFHPATNDWAEKELTMKVTAVPVLDNIVKMQEVFCVGAELKLSCRIHSFYPSNIKVTWYREDDVILQSSTTEPLQEHDSLYHVTSSLRYTPTMTDLGKKFRCEVQHDSLWRPKHAIWTLDDLLSPPTLGDIQCESAQPQPGTPVTFSCKISDMYPGDPGIQWQWSAGDLSAKDWQIDVQQDPEYKMFSGITKLTLTPDRRDHLSEITLDVSHCGKRFKKKTFINFKGFPVLSEISSEPNKADYGRPVTLRCDVTGCSPGDISSVTWSERGEQKEARGTGDVLSCYLTITPTARHYGKVFTCSVTQNGMPSITKEGCLQLPDRPPTLSEIVVRPARVTANQKASFQVTISRFAPRELQIKWYKEYNMFNQNDVSTSDPVIGSDSLYSCSSTLTFTPKTGDDGGTIRCEVMYPQSKVVREKRFTLSLSGVCDKTKEEAPKPGLKKTFHIREITCVTERPRVGEEVTLVGYIEECQADSAEFSWYKGMYVVDEKIDNKQDGSDCKSTITFTPETSDTDCTIKLEVFYNYQTVEEFYTLQLV